MAQAICPPGGGGTDATVADPTVLHDDPMDTNVLAGEYTVSVGVEATVTGGGGFVEDKLVCT